MSDPTPEEIATRIVDAYKVREPRCFLPGYGWLIGQIASALTRARAEKK